MQIDQLIQPKDAKVIITQMAVEAAGRPDSSGNLQITQMCVEVIKLPDPAGNLQITQMCIELPKAGLNRGGVGWKVEEA